MDEWFAQNPLMGALGGVIALACDVVYEGDVADFNVVEGPFSEEFDLGGSAYGNKFLFLFFDGVFDGLFDVRHGCCVPRITDKGRLDEAMQLLWRGQEVWQHLQ